MRVLFEFDLKRFCKSIASASIFLLALAPATAARADFLDDLFGGGAQEQAPRASAAPRARRAPVPRASFSIRLNEGKKLAHGPRDKKSVAFRDGGQGEARFPKPVFCYARSAQPAGAPDSADTRLHDGTLRSGDTVVTQTGILVFKGHAACPHNAGDFVALAAAGLPRGKREALFALERTLHAAQREREANREKDADAGTEKAKAVKVAGQPD